MTALKAPSPTIREIREGAIGLASAFFDNGMPDLAKLWTLATFFEKFLMVGSDGTREEYAPKAAAPLRAVPKATM